MNGEHKIDMPRKRDLYRTTRILKCEIYEFRALRTMMNALGGEDVFIPAVYKRLHYLNKALWPVRNERLKKYNDSLKTVEHE